VLFVHLCGLSVCQTFCLTGELGVTYVSGREAKGGKKHQFVSWAKWFWYDWVLYRICTILSHSISCL
jgi:hypothetical protein